MKNYLRILYLVLFVGIYSCSDNGEGGDNCEGINCGPGICENGTCDCPDGIEGTTCEIISNSVYYGNYNVVKATCGTSNNTTNIEAISISAHSNANPTEIELTASSSSDSAVIEGTILNGRIEAEGPFSFFTLEISGTFSDDDNFEVTLTGGGLVCSGVTYAK